MKKTRRIAIRLEPDLYDLLEAQAAAQRVAVSWLVREFIIKALRPKARSSSDRRRS